MSPRRLARGGSAVGFAVSVGACASLAGISDIIGADAGGGNDAGDMEGAAAEGDGSNSVEAPDTVTEGSGSEPSALSGTTADGAPEGSTRSATDSATDGTDDAGDAGCPSHSLGCSGGQPQICASGTWVDNGAACSGTAPVCLNGGCVACSPGQKQCFSGSVLQACSSGGVWQNDSTCSGATPYCVSDACSANPPSCQANGVGLTQCGPGESCCTSLEVPGGTFYRTYTNSGSGPTGEGDPAAVSGFRLDKYLVTVARFRRFVTAYNGGSGFTPAAGSGRHVHLNGGRGLADSANPGTYETGWVASDNGNIAPTSANFASCSSYGTWTSAPGAQDNLPINCVNWWEAYAFCIWDGGFLPTEAEWEYAAAGGAEQREYPWGSTAVGTPCPGVGCSYAIYGCYYPNGSGGCVDVTNVAPVGTATSGVGLWGQLDMAGEMWEWNMDWYATYVNPCTDCAYLSTPTVYFSRAYRGGDFLGTTVNLLPPTRNYSAPTYRFYDIGLRCARTP